MRWPKVGCCGHNEMKDMVLYLSSVYLRVEQLESTIEKILIER